MAFVRPRDRADGTKGYTVVHKDGRRQVSLGTFDDETEAEEFRDTVNTIGPEKAMKAWGINPTPQAAKRSSAPTVTEWLTSYIETRTGVTKATLHDYQSYRDLDIAPKLGDIPIDLLTPNDVADWVNWMASRPSGRKDEDGEPLTLSGKTIANRHGFLSAALNTAVTARPPIITHNPADGTRIPRSEKAEMCFLTHDEFALLLSCFTEHWRPMVRFMVASGARFGELSALKPTDVDRARNSVHIGRGWKRTYEKGNLYELGATKTKKSVRTISIAKTVLDALDYSGEYLFTSTNGNPVRIASFRSNVWYPTVAKAQKKGLGKAPRIHDMRHTCASWMIAGGADMYAVQRHLGHESIQTTINSYTHLDTRQAEAAADIIGRALS